MIIRDEKAKNKINELNAAKEQQKKAERRKQLEELAHSYGITNMIDNSQELTRNLGRRLKLKYADAFPKFCSSNDITESDLLDTCSTLGICAVSSNTFYFQFTPAVGQMLHSKAMTSNTYSSSVLKLNEMLKIENTGMVFNINSIPLKNIIMFKTDGNRQFVAETNGGGVNLSGAVMGGMLFGTAGAIVGSNMGTDIKTNTKEIDSRVIRIYYYVDGKPKIETILSSNYPMTMEALRKLIPEKEESVVQFESQKSANPTITHNTLSVSNPPANGSAVTKMKEYKELLDMGIITQEEFDKKKRQLLDL